MMDMQLYRETAKKIGNILHDPEKEKQVMAILKDYIIEVQRDAMGCNGQPLTSDWYKLFSLFESRTITAKEAGGILNISPATFIHRYSKYARSLASSDPETQRNPVKRGRAPIPITQEWIDLFKAADENKISLQDAANQLGVCTDTFRQKYKTYREKNNLPKKRFTNYTKRSGRTPIPITQDWVDLFKACEKGEISQKKAAAQIGVTIKTFSKKYKAYQEAESET